MKVKKEKFLKVRWKSDDEKNDAIEVAKELGHNLSSLVRWLIKEKKKELKK